MSCPFDDHDLYERVVAKGATTTPKRDEALEALEAKVRELTRAATGGRESTAMTTKRDEGMSEERLSWLRDYLTPIKEIVPVTVECLDEIDRLRAELAELERQENSTSAAVATVQEWINGRIAALEAEVERLKQAIREAYAVPSSEWAQAVLRDALRDEEKKG